ncbi:MAG: hypothetical protein V3R86_01245 [Candidatus Hydrothermarchaeaceae archaeon]
METITLERLHKEMLSIKKELKRISFILGEDFELSKEAISSYVDHEEVLKEFS